MLAATRPRGFYMGYYSYYRVGLRVTKLLLQGLLYNIRVFR